MVNLLNKLTALFQNDALFAFLKNIATFELLKDNLSISGLSNLEMFGMRITHSAFANARLKPLDIPFLCTHANRHTQESWNMHVTSQAKIHLACMQCAGTVRC